jgi:hypothetical protein
LASLQDNKACFVALRQAETAIGQARPEEDPPWMYSFDDGRLAALAGTCYRQLGKLTAAEQTLQEALEALDASCTRRRSEALLELALVQLEKRTSTRRAGSPPSPRRLPSRPARFSDNGGSGRSGRVLTRWSDTEAVRVLDERLVGLL